MPVGNSSFVKDSILFIRNAIAAGVTDPLSTARPSGQNFVLTDYPQKQVVYPIITVKSRNVTTDRPLGHSSEAQLVRMTIEVRCWARGSSERDALAQAVYDCLRGLQLDAAGSNAYGLFDFTLTSTVPVDEPGDAGIKSSVSEYRYGVILG